MWHRRGSCINRPHAGPHTTGLEIEFQIRKKEKMQRGRRRKAPGTERSCEQACVERQIL